MNVNNNPNEMQLVVWSPRAEVSSVRIEELSDDDDNEELESNPDKKIGAHSSSISISSSQCSSKSNSNDSLEESSSSSMFVGETPTPMAPAVELSFEYRVEEPTFQGAATGQNRLKRKFSQLNKMNIEEMNPAEWSADEAAAKPSFYLVDQSAAGGDRGSLDAQDLAYLSAFRRSTTTTPGAPSSSSRRVVITDVTNDHNYSNSSSSVFDQENKKSAKVDVDEQEMEF